MTHIIIAVIIMKKAYITVLSILLCLLIGSILLVSSRYKSSATKVVNAENQTTLPTIIIDAGHGGEDSGALSANGTAEKDVNLDISLTLDKLLKTSGFNTVMIRTDDTSIHNPDASTTRERTVSDIHNRVNISNSDKNNILISIHQNHFSDSKYSGAQMFYSKNNYNSRNLAECIKGSVTGLLQNSNTRECKESSGVYLLDNVTVPAVIVECGFLSNTQEAELLSTAEYRDNMAYSVYLGIMEYSYLYR